MKFRSWLNENVWVDAAKDFLKLPAAMRDQEVMQYLGKLPEPVQMQMVSTIPYYQKMKDNRARGISLTLFKSFKEIDDVIKGIEDETQDQWREVEEVKNAAAKANPMKIKLGENTELSKTVDFTPSQKPLAKTVVRGAPAVPVAEPTQTLYMLEKKLGDASTNNRMNHFEIRRMWDTLGWIEKKRADNYAKTGLRGLGESSELGGDAEMYFPNGFEELSLRINQAVNQVDTMSRHIDGALRMLGMKRQYTN